MISMGSSDAVKPGEKPETRWHLSLIPLYMALGSPGLLTTLVALSFGATVADIGVMSAAGAMATFVFSLIWGGLSDISGNRKRYLLFFIIALSPVFLALSMANSVTQLILLYTLLVGIASGVAPVGVMYTVECCTTKTWQRGVARYNSITTVGNIIGLVTYTFAARFYETRMLFYIAAVMCLLAAFLLWKLGQKSETTPSPAKSLHNLKSFFSLVPDRLRRLKPPKNLKQLKPLELLLLASFVHWIGVNSFGVGQTPLMRTLGLSDSEIFAINGSAGAAQAIAFIWIAPRVGSNHKKLLSRIVAIRGGLILCWSALPFFIIHPLSYVFVFPLVISIVWSVLYALMWLPITNFAISHAPTNRKGSVQGELLATTGVANAVGSGLGGLVITAYGYTTGFVLSSIVAMLAIPVISGIEITQ